MTRTQLRRRRVAMAALPAVLLLTGCGSDGSTGGGMMGGSQRPPGEMTGADRGYHYSRLTCSAPTSLPGTTVRVTIADMGMTQMMRGDAPMGAPMMLRATPGSAPAGQVTFVAQNRGWRTHELVVLPLTGGAGAGQRVPGPDGKVDEAASLGEASASCAAGSGEGVASGAVGWTQLTLAAGRYELVCNLKNHYANGMHQELDVL